MSRNKEADVRIQRGAVDARGSRAAIAQAQRPENDGARSDEDYRRMIHNEFVQEALPSVPEIPGYHLCWLSTTSAHDPIHKRIRLGYTPVKIEEIRGGEELVGYKMKSGELEGCIGCNEMVLFKLPLEKYQMIMSEFHHRMPLAEESAIYERLEDFKNKLGKTGNKPLVNEVGAGFRSLAQDADDEEDEVPVHAADRPAPAFEQ